VAPELQATVLETGYHPKILGEYAELQQSKLSEESQIKREMGFFKYNELLYNLKLGFSNNAIVI
jgi:hypothetical protein